MNNVAGGPAASFTNGALCAAITDCCFPSSVAGVEPSEGFLKTAKENLAGRAALHYGSATKSSKNDRASAAIAPRSSARSSGVTPYSVLGIATDPRAAHGRDACGDEACTHRLGCGTLGA